MPSCAVPTCRNSVGRVKKKDGITFHVFPSDEVRRAQWAHMIQKTRPEFWKPSNSTLVCSNHFDEKYFYETRCGLKRLRKDAIPNKNMIMAADEADPFIEISRLQTSNEVTLLQSADESQSLIGDADVSDTDSVFDTPRILKLKTQLHRKQNLCQKYIQRIKALTQRNRRLIKRNESLKNILRSLKLRGILK